MKKITIYSEITYFLSIILMALALAMLSAANFGISMVSAPSYIISQVVPFLSFGMADYIFQGVLFILTCLIIKRFKFIFLFSFLTGVLYGTILDLFRLLIPILNPDVFPAGSMELYLRIILFISGILILPLSVALGFKSYLYPQVNDFLVKSISGKFNKKINLVKYIFDIACLALSIILSLSLFGKFVGISWGTLVIVITNGFLIGLFSKLLDKLFVFKPLLKKLSNFFNDTRLDDIK